jgi:hypothetical protein
MGGHVTIDHGLRVKALQEKASIEELKLLKAEVPKWTRAVDLRWMCGSISRTSGMKYSRRKAEGESVEVPKWTRAIDLRRMCGRRSAISEKSHSRRKRSVLNKNS